MFKRQLTIFFSALMFYTRIPCPQWVGFTSENLNKSTRYFPLIGWIVGALTAGLFEISSIVFDLEIAIVGTMIAGVLITGAFHEDGFADVCDGFGGGWTKAKILEIMKDSRVGAYGVIGLILLFLLKFYLLLQIVRFSRVLEYNAFVVLLVLFITAHALSRFAAISIIFTHPYVREDITSKSKPIAQNFTWKEIAGASFFGLLPIFFLSCFHYQFAYAIVFTMVTRWLMARYFNKWIDGYTGDCLGATQQVCEVVFYLSIIGIWKFI